jgi:hypothetical protein
MRSCCAITSVSIDKFLVLLIDSRAGATKHSNVRTIHQVIHHHGENACVLFRSFSNVATDGDLSRISRTCDSVFQNQTDMMNVTLWIVEQGTCSVPMFRGFYDQKFALITIKIDFSYHRAVVLFALQYSFNYVLLILFVKFRDCLTSEFRLQHARPLTGSFAFSRALFILQKMMTEDCTAQPPRTPNKTTNLSTT